MAKILFADDDAATRAQLGQALEESGHHVQLASSGEEAVARVQGDSYDLVLTDLVMGKVGGLEVLAEVLRSHSDIPVVVLTGQGSIEAAVEAMRQGAFDFLTKPVNLDRLDIIIEKAMDARRLVLENTELRRRLSEQRTGRKLLGESERMRNLLDDIGRVADSIATVLVLGESGTGKELVAEAIHGMSQRAQNPLVKVNCAALAEGVLESELFGHERGAYTGAHRARLGRFESAQGGTIFLDEIGDLAPTSQIKLLRVLQERTIERVGATKPVPVDVRVIAATNIDLSRAVSEGRFREDLFYRLSVVTLHVPPLRERQGDLPLLTNSFITEFNALHGRKVEGVAPQAMQAISAYRWPGNVRELRNCIEAIVVRSSGGLIRRVDLPAQLRGQETEAEIVLPLGLTLDDVSRRYILGTLESVGGNKAQAARVLGIGNKTLYRKLHEYGDEEHLE